ncbi:ER membrane protein complex subunit 3 [Smittium culicis]|uniref:ER membrane protein complex subunit 3 n=1 Tax=Smittium culicis TaxID=133412 RepID=A0A1R1XUG1_9FUNG|nr:ER membrane protein complex subunit 3 [Smittium culicis]
MDVTWVSSLSWYFLNLFGLNGIYGFILGEGNSAGGMDDLAAMGGGAGLMQMQQMQQQQQQAGGGVPLDYHKLFLAAKESLHLIQHNWDLSDVEDRVLAMYL